MSTPKAPSIAQWSISLTLDCPVCGEYVDLLEYVDFWHDHPTLGVPESGTDKSDNLEVTCPNCGKSYVVCCVF